MQETFHFAVDSALLGELGEKLVSAVHVALAELVKNAYDADATSVRVTITPISGQGPEVIIEDDGIGMTIEEVRSFWMKIGTSNKAAEPYTRRFGRLKTGSKGVGRFACRRLGTKLDLRTCAASPARSNRSAGRFQVTSISFDWSEFHPGKDVESITCIGSTSVANKAKVGTTLKIRGSPTDEWQVRGFEYLQRQLAVLASNRGARRKGYEEDPGFNVILEAPGFSGQLIDLRNEVIDATWGTLIAEVTAEGRARCELNAKGIGGTKRYISKPIFPHVAGAKLKLGVLPVLREEARRPALLAKYVVSDVVNEWGGVQVRFNGFRMYPYGDPRDDWLQIDADRGRRVGKPESSELFDFAASLDGVDAGRTLLNMLGMRNYIGQVEVSSEIKQLTPRIDRQGFVENSVFEELRAFARFAVDWANIHRDHFIQLRESEEVERARRELKPVLNLEGPKDQIIGKAASFLTREIKRIVKRLPERQQRETQQTLVRTVRVIEAASADSTKQLVHLRQVASASTLTLLFAHEVRTVIGTLGGMALRLKQLAGKYPKSEEELRGLSDQLTEAKNRFDTLIGMTGIVGSYRRRDELTEIHLHTAAERAVACFHLIVEDYNISIDVSGIPDAIVVGPMIEGEVYTILLNLLSNAVKAVIAGDKTPRRIHIGAIAVTGGVALRVCDNGIGLDPNFFEDVFVPFISDPTGRLYDALEEKANPEDALLTGGGSGLGLSIARDIASSRGGSIRFVHPEAPWATCVEVILP